MLQNINKQLIRSTTQIINKKWTVNLVRDMAHAGFYPRRFKEFLILNPGLSSKVLATRLQEMEKNKLINKIITPTKPKVFLYFMTETGRDLMLILSSLATFGFKWVTSNIEETIAPRNGNSSQIFSTSESPFNTLLKESSSQTLKSISNKWTLELITDLRMEKSISVRFSDFLKLNKGLSHKVLAERLKYLELESFIMKNQVNFNLKNPEYVLTEKGNDIDRILYELSIFGLKWYAEEIFGEKLTDNQIAAIVEGDFKLLPHQVNFKSVPSVGKINLPK